MIESLNKKIDALSKELDDHNSNSKFAYSMIMTLVFWGFAISYIAIGMDVFDLFPMTFFFLGLLSMAMAANVKKIF